MGSQLREERTQHSTLARFETFVLFSREVQATAAPWALCPIQPEDTEYFLSLVIGVSPTSTSWNDLTRELRKLRKKHPGYWIPTSVVGMQFDWLLGRLWRRDAYEP